MLSSLLIFYHYFARCHRWIQRRRRPSTTRAGEVDKSWAGERLQSGKPHSTINYTLPIAHYYYLSDGIIIILWPFMAMHRVVNCADKVEMYSQRKLKRDRDVIPTSRDSSHTPQQRWFWLHIGRYSLLWCTVLFTWYIHLLTSWLVSTDFRVAATTVLGQSNIYQKKSI